MEKLKLSWTDHTPAARWALAWLTLNVVAIGVVLALQPIRVLPLLRLNASAVALALAYLLARRGSERIAAVALCTILTFDFHLSAVANYADGDRINLLIITSLIVVIMAGHLFGQRGIVATGVTGTLILLIGQAIFDPREYMATIAYPAFVAVIYLVFERRERGKDRGTIHRYLERDSHFEIQIDTSNGRLQIRMAKIDFVQLGLKRGDHIVIERGENHQAENGKQYILALSIRKVDQKND